MSIENSILCRSVMTDWLFLVKNTPAETVEQLSVSYIKICNNITNSKTPNKKKNQIFVARNTSNTERKILKFFECWKPNIHPKLILWSCLFFNILYPVKMPHTQRKSAQTQKIMQNIVQWAFKKGLAVTLVSTERSWVVGSNATDSYTTRWVHCLVHANGTLIQAKHYTLCPFAKLPLHQQAPEDVL